MLVIEYFGMRVFTRLLVIRKQYLLPVVVALCVIGCIGINNRVFDAITIFIFSIVGYLFKNSIFPLLLWFWALFWDQWRRNICAEH